MEGTKGSRFWSKRTWRFEVGDLVQYFKEGGWIMYLLLAASVIATVVSIERFLVLRKAKVNVNEFLAKLRKALLVNRSIQDGVKVCEQYKGPIASIMKAGLLKHGHDKEEIEKTIENAALYEMGRLERRLPILATVANVAPLLGFFGTVTGMMSSFDALAKAGLSNPGLVASGIKEALTTTAGGLLVAIPFQILYNFFMSKVNKFVRDVETSSNMLIETFNDMDRKGGTSA